MRLLDIKEKWKREIGRSLPMLRFANGEKEIGKQKRRKGNERREWRNVSIIPYNSM